MKILIVYTHPITASFNAAMLDAVSEELVNASHTIKIADLYSEQFQLAMIVEDFAQFENKPMPADVLAEQERIEWCDAIVFIFPIWW